MICWQMGKTSCKEKTQPGEFKVTTLQNPLINNQAVTSIRNLTTILDCPKISTYSLTFAPIPNWTWSCSRLLSFVAQISNLWLISLHRSQYLINSSNLIDCCWLQSSPLHKRWRDQEALGHKTLRHTKCSSFTHSIWVLPLYFHTWWLLK